MSIKIMSLVWENETLGPTDKMVLLSLADHSDEEGCCYPSVKRLMRRTGLKERAVQGALKRLESSGWLTVEKNAGKRGTNLYTLHPTPALNAPPHEMHPALDAPTPRTKCTPTPALDAPEPSVTINEPSRSDQSSPDPTFSRFWEEWPLAKIGKKKAEAAFKRLSQADRSEAIRCCRTWAERWRRQYPGASDLHPTTYLNGRRWNDEFPDRPQAEITELDAKRARWRKIAAGGRS